MLGTPHERVKSWHSPHLMSNSRRLVFVAGAMVLTAISCGDPVVPSPRSVVRPSPALVVAHVDATLILHVDVGMLRRSSFGPAANGKLLEQVARMADVPWVGRCGQTASIDAFDDLVVSWNGANVHVGAAFAKGLSEATKEACARELASSVDRRGDLVVSPPGLALEKGGAEGHFDVLLEGPRVATLRGRLDEAGISIEANFDTDGTGTTMSAKVTARTPIRAREVSTTLDRVLGASLDDARKAHRVEEAHVVQGANVVLSMRLLGDAHAQEIAGAEVARALAARTLGEKSTAGLREVRAKIGSLADALESYGKAHGGTFPVGSPWVPGVTPRGARVPVVSDSAQDPAWASIGISWKNERTAFRYRFVTSPDGKLTTIEAHGDMDGNQRESTFRMSVESKADGTITRSKLEETDASE